MDIQKKYKVVLADISKANNDYKYGYYYSQDRKILQAIQEIKNVSMAVARKEQMSVVVETPGVFVYDNMQKNTDFRAILFTKPGKFSLLKIYKAFREGVAEGKDWANLGLATGSMSDVADNISAKEYKKNSYDFMSALKGIMPFHDGTIEYNFENDKVWNELCAGLDIKLESNVVNKKEEPKAAANDFAYEDHYMLINDRYVPVLIPSYNADRWNEAPQIYYLDKDGYPKYYSKEVFPGAKVSEASMQNNLSANLKSNLMMVHSPSYNQEDYRGWYLGSLDILAFDIKTNTFIRSNDFFNIMWPILRGLKDKLLNMKDFYGQLLDIDSPSVFLEELNAYFAKKGFAFEATCAVPTWFHPAAETHDWTKGDHKYHEGDECAVYNVSVTYKKEILVGAKSERTGRGGWFVLEKDENGDFIMVQSVWCQRVSKWTKKTGTIDQKNKDWLVEDWLAGPYAEKWDLNVNEAPIIFCGNKMSKKATTKAAILNKLKANIAK